MIQLFYTAFLLFSTIISGTHALYLSVLTVGIDKEIVDVTVKVFNDDFNDAIKNFTQLEITSVDSSQLHVMNSYFENHLIVDTSCDTILLKCVSVHSIGDSYSIRMNGKLSQGCNLEMIQADYLLELFPTQKNILHLEYAGEKKFKVFEDSSTKYFLD